jgi:hypothetical protein
MAKSSETGPSTLMITLLETYSLSFAEGLNTLAVISLQHFVVNVLTDVAIRLDDDATPSAETVAQYKV